MSDERNHDRETPRETAYETPHMRRRALVRAQAEGELRAYVAGVWAPRFGLRDNEVVMVLSALGYSWAERHNRTHDASGADEAPKDAAGGTTEAP